MARIRPASIYQERRAPIRLLADHAIPRLRAGFLAGLKAGRKRINRARAKELMFTGRLDELWATVDWLHMKETLKAPLGELGDVWMKGGALGADRITKAFRSRGRRIHYHHPRLRKALDDAFSFDRYDETTRQLIRAYQDSLIRELGVDSRNVIENTIMGAMRDGRSADDTVSSITSVIGLTDRQAQAVENFRRELINRDPAALNRALLYASDAETVRALYGQTQPNGETIDNLVDNYADSYLAYRAQTIAQTEATRASSLGLQDSYRQAVDRGAIPEGAVTQQWKVALDEKVCPVCLGIADANPNGVGLDEPFQGDEGSIDGPPAHVNCRCSIEIVTDLDKVPDLPEEGAPGVTPPGVYATSEADADKVKREWVRQAPNQQLDEIIADSQSNQILLASIANPVAEDNGTVFVDPGIKTNRERIEEKIAQGRAPAAVTDIVRGGFKVTDPSQADSIVADLAQSFPILDEGWKTTDAGYFDRKVLVQFPNGQIGELQFWEPSMFDAKENVGHKLYEQWRVIDPASTEASRLQMQMQSLYGSVPLGAQWAPLR